MNKLTVKVLVLFGVILLVLGSLSQTQAQSSSSGREGNWRSNAQGAPSLKVCRDRVARNPKDANAQNDLGWALRQNGDSKEAEAALRESLNLNSGLACAHSNLSVVLLDQGKNKEAVEEGKKAVVAADQNPIFHVVYGNALSANGSLEDAINEYKIAIRQRPDYENAYYNLARALFAGKQKLEAKVALSQALGLDPKDERALKLLDQLEQ